MTRRRLPTNSRLVRHQSAASGGHHHPARRGWPIGLRFDPLIYDRAYEERYRDLVRPRVLQGAPRRSALSQSRPVPLPQGMYKTMRKLYPDEKLLAYGLEEKDGMVSYRPALAQKLHDFCANQLLQYIPAELFFPGPSHHPTGLIWAS